MKLVRMRVLDQAPAVEVLITVSQRADYISCISA